LVDLFQFIQVEKQIALIYFSNAGFHLRDKIKKSL
jgi:hypothetical protein